MSEEFEEYKPNHYDKEREEFSKEYDAKLETGFAEYAYDRLRGHYHFRQRLEFYGHGGARCRTFVIRLPWNPSVAKLCHEVAHAVYSNKYRFHEEKKHHTKKWLSCMRRVVAYYWAHEHAWRGAHQAGLQRSKEVFQRQVQRQQAQAAEKQTPEYKLAKLRMQEKRWLTKLKRAETGLKKVRRRIRIWERKVKAP